MGHAWTQTQNFLARSDKDPENRSGSHPYNIKICIICIFNSITNKLLQLFLRQVFRMKSKFRIRNLKKNSTHNRKSGKYWPGSATRIHLIVDQIRMSRFLNTPEGNWSSNSRATLTTNFDNFKFSLTNFPVLWQYSAGFGRKIRIGGEKTNKSGNHGHKKFKTLKKIHACI